MTDGFAKIDMEVQCVSCGRIIHISQMLPYDEAILLCNQCSIGIDLEIACGVLDDVAEGCLKEIGA